MQLQFDGDVSLRGKDEVGRILWGLRQLVEGPKEDIMQVTVEPQRGHSWRSKKGVIVHS